MKVRVTYGVTIPGIRKWVEENAVDFYSWAEKVEAHTPLSGEMYT